MSEYHLDDLRDPDREVVRPKGVKKHSSFHYCKWAAGDWEARYYAYTPAHRAECERHINQLVNNPAWFKYKPKVDRRAAVANNKARGKRR